ncbi:MAG: XrtA/PEP-CTERM system TPR-repeat protein PrsT [Thiobacillus sp.]
MTRRNASLITLLILALSAPLGGCDATARLTEQEHIQRAKDFEDKGNLKGSIIELKNAILKNPDSPQARLLLGQVYLKVGMGAEAEKELTQAQKLGVSQETLNPQLGEALLLMGEPKRVLEEIRSGDQTSPANRARILQLRGDALLRLGQLKDGCSLYQQSLDIDNKNPPTYWGLAQCAIAEHDNKKAREWLDSALKIQVRQARSWVHVGDLEQFERDFEAALAAYSSALKLEPEDLEALQSRVIVNVRLERLEPARLDVEKIRKLAPNSLAAHYLQGLLAYKEKKYPEARDALQAALKIAPNYVPALLLSGNTEFVLGNLQTAELHLNKVVRAVPNNTAALRMLAASQLRLGRPDDAERTLAPIDFAKTKDAGIYTVAGEIALAKKDFAKAASHFETAATLNPDNAAIRTELGLARLAQGDARAMTDLQAASEMDADSQADTIIILNQLSKKQYDAALASIPALEKKQPKSPMAPTYRGTAYLGKGDVAKARDSFNQALKFDPRYFPAAASLAQLDLVDGKTADARKRYEGILKAEPRHLQAMLALADLSLREQDEKGHLNWLEKAVKAHPQALEPRVLMTRYYLAKGENNRALATAREAVAANPGDPEALNLLGGTQLTSGDTSGAITTFTEHTKKASQSPDAYMRLAMAQVAARNLGAARAALQKSLQLQPDHLQSQDALISLELSDKKPDAALKIARQMQGQRPNHPLGFDREGDVHLDQKRLAQAIQSYERSLEKGAGSVGLTKLHRTLIQAGDLKTAEHRLTDWLKRYPNDLAVRNHAAEYYMFSGRIQDAIAQYQEIQRQKPDNALILNNLASLYQREKDPRALATAEQALKLAPNNPAIQDTLGWMLVEQGQASRGLELLSKAAASAPKAGMIRYHHAVALARTGNQAKARQELERVLREFSPLPAAEAETARQLLKTL